MTNQDINNLERKLDSMQAAPLSHEERDVLWSKISPQIASVSVQPKKRDLRLWKGIMGGFLLGFGMVSTISYADNSVPGDLLFPVDQAIERAQIALANDQQKTILRERFTKERIREAQQLIIKTEIETPNNEGEIATSSVFMEDNEKLVRAVHNERLDATLSVLRSEASSTAVTVEEKQALEQAIHQITLLLNPPQETETPATTTTTVISPIEVKTETKPEESKVEVKSPTQEIRIETKNGNTTTEIKTATTTIKTVNGVVETSTSGSGSGGSGSGTSGSGSGSSGGSNQNSGSGSSGGSSQETIVSPVSSSGSPPPPLPPPPAPTATPPAEVTPPPPPSQTAPQLSKAEARVKAGQPTQVKLEFGATRDEYNTALVGKAEIVAEIIARHPGLLTADVTAILLITN